MQGTNMGIIEGRRLLNNNPSVDNEVKQILNDFVVMQEDSVEKKKKYLSSSFKTPSFNYFLIIPPFILSHFCKFFNTFGKN